MVETTCSRAEMKEGVAAAESQNLSHSPWNQAEIGIGWYRYYGPSNQSTVVFVNRLGPRPLILLSTNSEVRISLQSLVSYIKGKPILTIGRTKSLQVSPERSSQAVSRERSSLVSLECCSTKSPFQIRCISSESCCHHLNLVRNVHWKTSSSNALDVTSFPMFDKFHWPCE